MGDKSMDENAKHGDRRQTLRKTLILPGRFRSVHKAQTEPQKGGWFKSHISNISIDGFCLALVNELTADEIIEFEYTHQEATFQGKAKIAWIDAVKGIAGCYILEYEKQ